MVQPEPMPQRDIPRDLQWNVDPDEYRRVIGRFATGITVVTSRVDGVEHAITVNAFTSVSLDPVRVLCCVEKTSRFHEAVLRSGYWAVSVLSSEDEEVSRWFATSGRPVESQLDHVKHSTGRHTGAPVLADAIAALECRTSDVFDGGDHSIVLGQVLDAFTPNPGGDPLLYYEGGYAVFRHAGG